MLCFTRRRSQVRVLSRPPFFNDLRRFRHGPWCNWVQNLQTLVAPHGPPSRVTNARLRRTQPWRTAALESASPTRDGPLHPPQYWLRPSVLISWPRFDYASYIRTCLYPKWGYWIFILRVLTGAPRQQILPPGTPTLVSPGRRRCRLWLRKRGASAPVPPGAESPGRARSWQTCGGISGS